MRALPVWFVLVLACLCPSTRAHADIYEWERTKTLLAHERLELDPAPEGKTIAWVRVVRDEVFIKDDAMLIPILLPKPNPLWPNWFHATTREDVVRRELLFETGAPASDARIEESMRNLRNMGIFALVRIVAVRTKDPGAVGIVVHTRDLWSLRLEQDFSITRQLDSLLLRITERNLAGRQKAIGADFTLVPKTYTLRQFYYSRRVWGSSVSLKQNVAVIFNRDSSDAEGSVWSASVGQPYFNLKQRYAYDLGASYSSSVARRLLGGKIDTYPRKGGPPFANRVWREHYKRVGISGSLQRGESYKQILGSGFSFRELDASATRETDLPWQLREAFERDVFPRQRREIGPSLSYGLFIPTYATFQNLGSFGQSENVRVGPSLDLSVRAPLRAFGSSSNSYVLAGSLSVVVAPGGGLIEAAVAATTRYEDNQLVDQLSTGLLRGATPIFWKLRLVSRSSIEARRNDTAQTLVALGANNGLRGYPSQSIYGYGASRVLQNVELRTLPIELQAVHVGGVLFCDVGSVYAKWRELELHYAVGLGLRVFFPQFNRYPFSFDGGLGTDPPFRLTPTFQGGQVVPLTATEDALSE